MRKLLKVGEMAHLCQCLHLSGHPTDSVDGTTCVFCGYYTEQRKATQPDINRQKRLLKLFAKKGVKVEDLQKDIWWNRIDELRARLGLCETMEEEC